MNTEKKSAKSMLSTLWSQYSFIFVLIAIFIVFALTSSKLTWSGVMNIFRHSAVVGILALGMGLICLTGEIDLSVGSMMAFVAGLGVVVYNLTGSILLTLVCALLLGAAFCVVNGVLVGVVEMPAFIVTLATMLIYRSIAQYLCQHLPKKLIGGGRMSLSERWEGTWDFYESWPPRAKRLWYCGSVNRVNRGSFMFFPPRRERSNRGAFVVCGGCAVWVWSSVRLQKTFGA